MIDFYEKVFAPPHSIIFISDPKAEIAIPDNTGAALVTFTSTCVVVGTLSELDGETTVKLGGELVVHGHLVFEGQIATPNLQIAVSDSEGIVHLLMPVRTVATHLRIWVNDLNEPDAIGIEAK